MDKKAKTIHALKTFRRAYFDLLSVWDENDILNNTKAASKYYPFQHSFDELNIPEWIEKTIIELNDTNGEGA